MQLQNTRTEPAVLSFITIRRTIGWLGILLPVVLVGVSAILHSEKVWQQSISHYYYTLASGIFVGSLCAVGLFLITYKGFGPLDDLATNFAGVFAFGVAFFPTTVPPEGSKWNIYAFPYPKNIATIHFTSAALFFVTLALISIFLFTKSKHKSVNPRKVARNRIYRTCGGLIFLFIGAIAVYTIKEDTLKERFARYNPTFWLECMSLVCFGVSWLVKGETIFKDKASYRHMSDTAHSVLAELPVDMPMKN